MFTGLWYRIANYCIKKNTIVLAQIPISGLIWLVKLPYLFGYKSPENVAFRVGKLRRMNVMANLACPEKLLLANTFFPLMAQK